jgi:lantibiotic biosynthesis protein
MPTIKKIIDESLKIMSNEDEIYFSGLFEGLCGSLIYLGYLNKLNYSIEAKKLFDTYLNRTINVVSETNQLANLSNGLAGIYWAFNFLINNKVIEDDYKSDIKQIGDLIRRSTNDDFIKGNYDLFYGFMGKIVALQSDPNFSLDSIKYGAIKVLDQISIKDKTGIYWQDYDDKNQINLGLAHGIPGIVSFLCDCQSEEGFSWVAKSLNWLSKIRNHGLYSYPSGIDLKENQTLIESRLAWCYGDLSVAFSFLKAGKYLANHEYAEEGKAIAKNTLNRDIANVGLSKIVEADCLDISICHGTTSIALMYKKIFELCGDIEFHKASRNWSQITQVETSKFLNSFHLISNQKEVFENIIYIKKYSFIEGLIGPLLFLLSEKYKNANEWERILLVNT